MKMGMPKEERKFGLHGTQNATGLTIATRTVAPETKLTSTTASARFLKGALLDGSSGALADADHWHPQSMSFARGAATGTVLRAKTYWLVCLWCVV